MAHWFRGLRLKLVFLVIAPLMVLAGLTVFAYNAVNKVMASLDTVTTVQLPLATVSGEMAEALQGAMRSMWAIYGSGTDLESRKLRKARFIKFIEQFEKAQREYEALPRSDAAQEIYKAVPNHWANVKSVSFEAVALFDKNTRTDDEAGRLMIVNSLRADIGAIESALDKLSELRITSANARAAEAKSSAELSLRLVMLIGLISGIGLFSLGVVTAARLSTTIGAIARDLSNSASEVGLASNQLSDASQKLSSGASEAASSLEETVASLEELSGMVKRNADHSSEAGHLSVAACETAAKGKQEVERLVTAMGDIASSSRKIEEIINVIDDIAFQTNLLALNAAVEAARAGEQGKGFAVVAEAVRNLALRSGEAAKNITGLIKESVEKVGHGTEIAGHSGQVLSQIVNDSKRVADLTKEIAMASNEQATGIAQISKAMNQLDQATQGNAASAEETASSSEELAAEAESMHTRVRDLVIVVEGQVVDEPKTKRDGHSPSRPHFVESKAA